MTGNWLKEDACDMLLSWQVTCGTFEESSSDKTCDTPMWLPGVALKWVWWNELWWRGMWHDLRCLLKNNLIDRSEILEHPIWSQDLELCQCLLLVVLTFLRIGERKGEDSARRLKKILLRPEKRLDDVCLSIICRGKIIHGDDLIRSKWIIQDDLKLSPWLDWLYESGDLCLVDSVGIPLWHLTWRVTRCATVCCDETHSKASSHKNVWNQTSICFAIRIKTHVDITDIHKYLIWSKVSSSLSSGPSSWVERSVTAVCPEILPCHRPSWPSPQSSPVSSSI